MKRTILLMAVCLCFIGNASAQWVVSDPGNLAQGIINTTKQIVQTSTTAKNTLDGFMEAQKIFQQGKVYYDALKAVHDVVKGGIKVKKSIELVAEISEIYVRNYQNMLADPNYTPDELTAISAGYAKLLSESADVLQDLKNVVNVTGMFADGCRKAGGNQQRLQKPAQLPQPRELLHPKEHIRVLPAGEEEERHRPGAGSLRLGG